RLRTNRGDGGGARTPARASAQSKVGRNDPCWCGSGKKYKHCHMRKDTGQEAEPAGAKQRKGG
ncbi:MAG: SEC-C metal-binding domain-containing protein, partial [Anaerolineae bacterium]